MSNRINPKPSPLASLTDAQQQQVISWIETHPPAKVLELIRQDPPDGFGIVTYDTSLRRFYARHKMADRRENALLVSEFTETPTDEEPLQSVTASATRQLAFEIAHAPCAGLKQFKALSRWVLKQRELDQKEGELALQASRFHFDREKWEYDIARQVLNHHNALAAIATDLTVSDEDKINRARSALFNRPIQELPR